MNYYEQLVGGRIKSRREALHLNQDELAQKVGSDQSRVSRWENGHSLPDKEYRKALLKTLGLSEVQLFGIEAPPPAPAQTVADMTPAELEALVARASKRDNTINLENARLKKELEAIPPAIRAGWAGADAETIALCTYFLTNDPSFLDILPAGLRKEFLTLVRSLGLSKKPSAPP